MSSLLVIFVGDGEAIFEGSESGRKQNVKLLQNMVYNTIQHHPPPPTPQPPEPHTVCTFSLGRGGGQREGRGATVHKYSSFVHRSNSSQAGSKIPVNTMPQSPLTGQFYRKADIKGSVSL